MIDFDMMLVHVGEFGLYQKILFLFQAPFAMFVTFVLFGQLFIYLYPRIYWCQMDPCLQHDGICPQLKRNLTVPWSITAGNFDGCFQYSTCPKEVDSLVNRAWKTCSNVIHGNTRQHCEYKMVDVNKGVAERIFTQRQQGEVCERIPFSQFNRRQRRYARNYGRYGSNGGIYEHGNHHKARTEWPYEYEHRTSTLRSTKPTTGSDEYNPRSTISSRNKNKGSSYRWNNFKSEGRSSGRTEGRNERKTCLRAGTKGRPQSDSTCYSQTFDLSFPINFSINAESIAKRATEYKERYGVSVKGKFDSRDGWLRNEAPCINWSWVGDDPPNGYTTLVMMEELRWLCNPDYWINMANAIFYIGAIIGGIGIGWIADNRGRVPALVTANMLGFLGGTLSAIFYTNFAVFMFLRFLSGMAFDNCFTMIYILVLEYVGPTYRTLVANLSIAVFYTIGTLIIPSVAVLVEDWRTFLLILSIPMLLSLLAIFIVPESARWLLSKGRTKEATTILRSFAKVNRKNLDDQLFRDFEDGANKLYEEFSQEKDPSLWEAFKKPRIAKNFMFLTIIWALIALVYDGHSRNILNLGDNVFISFAIASSTEFPADILLIFTLDRFGRRWLAFGAMCFSGAFSLISAFIPQSNMIGSLVTALISRFFVNVAFNIGLQYAAELLPTVIRAQGVNVIHIMGYVASIVSPFIASIGRTNPTLSLSLLGILACIAGILCLFLPETLGEELPNSLEEGQEFGKDQSFWNCPICAKPKFADEELVKEDDATSVQRRNNMRPSLRADAFRSSIISTYSSNRRITPVEQLLLNPSGSIQNTKLRRVYTH